MQIEKANGFHHLGDLPVADYIADEEARELCRAWRSELGPDTPQTLNDIRQIVEMGRLLGRPAAAQRLVRLGANSSVAFAQLMLSTLPRLEQTDTEGLHSNEPVTEGSEMVSTLSKVIDHAKKAVGVRPAQPAYTPGHAREADVALLKSESELRATLKHTAAAMKKLETEHESIVDEKTRERILMTNVEYVTHKQNRERVTKALPEIQHAINRLFHWCCDPSMKAEWRRIADYKLKSASDESDRARQALVDAERRLEPEEQQLETYRKNREQPESDILEQEKRISLHRELVAEAREKSELRTSEYQALRERMDSLKRAFFVELLS